MKRTVPRSKQPSFYRATFDREIRSFATPALVLSAPFVQLPCQQPRIMHLQHNRASRLLGCFRFFSILDAIERGPRGL